VTKSLYRAFLSLYPWDYANAFSEDMEMAFEEACGEQGRSGRWHFGRFVTSELFNLVWGVGKEWLAKLTTEESVRGRSLPDLRKMRPVGIAYEVWFASLDRSYRVKSPID
jgi:hypothetical protein